MNTTSKWGWWLSGLLLVATLLNYMDRQALGELSTLLKKPDVLNLDDARYGRLEKTFSWAFALGAVSFGFLVDRFGPKHLYPIALLGWSISGCACGLANQTFVEEMLGNPEETFGYGAYSWLFLCRTTLGFFEAGHWPCALVTLRNVLSEKDRPFGNSILQSGASMGAAITPFLIRGLSAIPVSWPVTFLCIGLLGMLWLPVWYSLVRNVELHPHRQAVQITERIVPGKLIVHMLLLVGLTLSMSLTWQFFRAWLPKFLKENQHYPDVFTMEMPAPAYVVCAYYVVADIGCLVSGYIATTLSRRFGMRIERARLVAFIACTACAGLGVFVTRVPPGWLQVSLLLLIGAGTLGLHPQYYAAVQELPRKHMGLLNGTLSAGTWFIVGQMQGMIGQHIKDTGDYTLGMTVAGLAPLVGLTCLSVLVFVPGLTQKAAPSHFGK
ncbi:MFS transporter [Zavarzinella formosa]|uniref:MFS transporter n=1 Tax=Zavarzinella formosa TaxID=360055 RepID=UPI0002E02D35|nr:MFS transporter [Zavarzinella formosa]